MTQVNVLGRVQPQLNPNGPGGQVVQGNTRTWRTGWTGRTVDTVFTRAMHCGTGECLSRRTAGLVLVNDGFLQVLELSVQAELVVSTQRGDS